jgi:hypothetical protein
MGVFSFVKAGGKKFGSIVGVGPKVNKSKLQKAIGDFKISSKKASGSMKKDIGKVSSMIDEQSRALRQIQQKQKGEKVTESGVSKGKDRLNRRFGSPKPKSNVEKIKETFSTKSKNLKPVDKKKQKGLAKLPIEVRNKMGYAKKGGVV